MAAIIKSKSQPGPQPDKCQDDILIPVWKTADVGPNVEVVREGREIGEEVISGSLTLFAAGSRK